MNTRTHLSFGRWEVIGDGADGARLTRLAYNGHDLLTPEPAMFWPPARDHGRYETRPVYGYDDCFPTVDAGRYPGREWEVPDHGELCWRPWQLAVEPDCLVCSVRSEHLPATFTRRLRFGGSHLRWEFDVLNHGDTDLVCLHTMHALMPLGQVTGLRLPGCGELYDEIADTTGGEVSAEELLGGDRSEPAGGPRMVILRGVTAGEAVVEFRGLGPLRIVWDRALLPHLGIWWNPGRYPDEAGCRRTECALEPMGGPFSSLARSARAGQTMAVPAGGSLAWQIDWLVADAAGRTAS